MIQSAFTTASVPIPQTDQLPTTRDRIARARELVIAQFGATVLVDLAHEGQCLGGHLPNCDLSRYAGDPHPALARVASSGAE